MQLFFWRRSSWDALPQLVSAFEVDPLLKRTFLNAIPVWELHKVVASKMFHISDICVALLTFCQRESVPMEKVGNSQLSWILLKGAY